MMRRAYNEVSAWSETPYGSWALFLLAFTESSCFPILLALQLIRGILSTSILIALLVGGTSLLDLIKNWLH